MYRREKKRKHQNRNTSNQCMPVPVLRWASCAFGRPCWQNNGRHRWTLETWTEDHFWHRGLRCFDSLTARGNTFFSFFFFFAIALGHWFIQKSTKSNLLPEAPRLNNITARGKRSVTLTNHLRSTRAWDGTAQFSKYPPSTAFNLLN